MNTHTVRLLCGVVGDVTTTLKAKELVGKFAMCLYTVDGETLKAYGRVAFVFEQGELDV